MNIIFKIKGVLFCILFFACSSIVSAQDSLLTYDHPNTPPTGKEILKWHEVFTYEVKYSFFKLGTIEVEVVSDTLYKGKSAWYLRSIITANSGIPFVGEEENHYNSIFVNTDPMPVPLVYWRDNVDEGHYDDTRYIFDHGRDKVYGRVVDIGTDTLELEQYGNSGHLSFFINRMFAGTDTSYKMPIYVDLEKGYLKIKNTSKKEMREYEAFEEPVETFYSEGETSIEGPFGFKGEFKSWYLTDDLRVPVEARVRVWLGNAKIRLINYKKELIK